jgi:glycosyltransferase involved in cell wall biosynthesis
MDTNTVVSVIVTLSKDSPILGEVIEELDAAMAPEFKFYEIIIVDDKHQENESEYLTDILTRFNRIRYIKLSRNVGRNIVQSAGIDSSIGDFVVTFDPYCDPISMIPTLVHSCQKSGGIIQGIASNPHRRNLLREAAANCFRKYCNKRLRLDLRKGAEEFRVMSRQAVNAFIQGKEQMKNLRTSTMSLGYSHEFVTYSRSPRSGEIDHRTFKGDLLNAITVVFSYSSHPLRLFTLCGHIAIITAILICFLFTTFTIADPAIKSVGYGFLTLLGISSLVIFLGISIVGEYILSIRNNLATRPLYHVEYESCSSIRLEDTVDSSIVKSSLSSEPQTSLGSLQPK